MFERYAVFYTPPAGDLARFGAEWLGWDSAKGEAVAHLKIEGVDVSKTTKTPRKYGIHGTLKAPFHLIKGATVEELGAEVESFAKAQRPVALARLALRHEHGFVALHPDGDVVDLLALASNIVRAFDSFRAPLTKADIVRRRQSNLTKRQDQQLLDWGYPYIFGDFHFHLTLSGRLGAREGKALMSALTPMVAPILPRPMVIDAITLVGQDREGMFQQIHRYALTG